MRSLLLTLAITATLFSCTKNEELIDRIEKSWTLQSVEGSSTDIDILSTWRRIEINDRRFTLFFTEEGEKEMEIATGRIEYCEMTVLSNCYKFIIETKSIDSDLALEHNGSKIITYLNEELTFTPICCDEISYFLN